MAVLFFILFGGFVTAPAQVQVAISMERNELLLYEAIDVKVQVTNQSGEAMDPSRMAGNEPWLDFLITTPDHEIITHTDRKWSPPRFALMPGQMRTVSLNLTPFFLIREEGKYQVTAMVAQAGQHYSSQTLLFSVMRGTTVWAQRYVASPAPGDVKGRPCPRLYSLLVHRHNKQNKNMLYARIQDPESGRIYCTMPVGELINYGDPNARIGKNGDLHIFHQSGTRIFIYTHISIVGKRLKARFFSNISSKPSMVVDENGETEVVGGEEIFLDKNQRETVIPTPSLAVPVPESKSSSE